MMSMALTLRITQRLAFTCRVCGMDHEDGRSIAALVTPEITRSNRLAAFPHCPCCWNLVGELQSFDTYQTRALTWHTMRRIASAPMLTVESLLDPSREVDPMLLPIDVPIEALLGPRVTAPVRYFEVEVSR